MFAPLTKITPRRHLPDASPGLTGVQSTSPPPAYIHSSERPGKPAALAWMIAIGAAFLATGLAGATRPVAAPDAPPARALAPVPEIPVEEITMADLPGEPAPLLSADSPEVPAAQPEDSPPAEPPAEELAEIPPPPPIDEVVPLLEVRPVPQNPAPQNPKPAASSPAPRPRPASAGPPTAPAASPAARAPGGQGNGGAGGAGNGPGAGGKGKFPQPPYPASARSKGLSGTVMLSISVAPSGEVSSVSVVGSSGSSELDGPAASWVQRRWKWPPGTARQYRMPVTFRLR